MGLGKDGQLTAGFYAGRTHSLIPAPGLDCLLGCQENKELLKIILDFMKEYKIKPYDEAAHRGLVRHVLLRKGFSSGGLMVCLVINGEELPHGGGAGGAVKGGGRLQCIVFGQHGADQRDHGYKDRESLRPRLYHRHHR